MKRRSGLYTALLQGLALALGIAVAAPALAQDKRPPRQDMVLKDDAKCTRCHDETEEYPVLSIAKTRHGVVADGRTPTCTSCHGESPTHVDRPADAKVRPPVDVGFGKTSKTPMEVRSQACLTCHQGGNRMNWHVSAHSSKDVACSSCHNVHTGKDKVQVKVEQAEVCANCHKAQRAQLSYPSRHPIKEGKVVCSQCHNPHGSTGPTMLVKGTVNETCYTCHAEKRGPFLFEHAPVREDCTSCHTPHGSINAPLLKARGPWLCQQCHLAQFHPSTLYSGNQLPPTVIPGGAAGQQVLARSCLNCHTQVHGSNHPSGPRKTR
jgi:DmsE family decaheme c-type cytochrome